MIWQLMQRDLAWRRMRWLTLAVAVFCVLWHFFAPADKDNGVLSMTLLLQVWLASMTAGLLTSLAQGKDTCFQSTLPVTIRQVFLAPIFSPAGLMWAPFARHGGPAGTQRSGNTVADCRRVAVWTVIFTLAGVMRNINIVLAFIVAATVLTTWRSQPKSFQTTFGP